MYEKTNFACLTMQRYGGILTLANSFNELPESFSEQDFK